MKRVILTLVGLFAIISIPFVHDAIRCGRNNPEDLKRVMIIQPVPNRILFVASAPKNCWLNAENPKWFQDVRVDFSDRNQVLRPSGNIELKFGTDFTGRDIESGTILVNKDAGTVLLKLKFDKNALSNTVVVNGEYRLNETIDRSN